MIAEILKELIAAGLQGESLVAAVERIEQAQPKAIDATAERRRAKDRARYRERIGIPPKPPFPPKTTETTEDGKVSLSSSTTLENQTNTEVRKKERARKSLLPDDWQPKPQHYAKAETQNQPRFHVEQKAEDMRNWARSKAIMRADWDATFFGFLRPPERGARNGKTSPSDRAYELAGQVREAELAASAGRSSDVLGDDYPRR